VRWHHFSKSYNKILFQPGYTFIVPSSLEHARQNHICVGNTLETSETRLSEKQAGKHTLSLHAAHRGSSMQEAPSPIYATFPGTGESQIDSGYTAQAGKQKLTITTRYSNWGLRATLQAIQGDIIKLDRSPTFPTHILKTTCLFSAPSHALCSTCS
jgi:hypothetical protein